MEWNIKPKVGMTVNVKLGSQLHKSSVLNIYEHYGVVDEVDITPIQDLMTLVICNGQWSLKGYDGVQQVSFLTNTMPASGKALVGRPSSPDSNERY